MQIQKDNLFEYVPTTARELGAQKAVETKGMQYWSEEQYAVAFYIAKYQTLPSIFGNKVSSAAEKIGVKPSSLAQCISRMRFVLNGEGLQTDGPKINTYVENFLGLEKSELISLMQKALVNGEEISDESNTMYGQRGKATPRQQSASVVAPDQLKLINQQRAEKGLKPYNPMARNYRTENVQKAKDILLNSLMESKDKTSFIANVKKSGTSLNESNEKRLSEWYDSKGKELKENKELNEWFASGKFKGFMNSLESALKKVESLRARAALYPEDWKGDESERVLKTLKQIWQTFTKVPGASGDTVSYAQDPINKISLKRNKGNSQANVA